MNTKRETSVYNNAHYNKDLRELVVTLWLGGKSHWEIDAAVSRFLSRRRRGRSRGQMKEAS